MYVTTQKKNGKVKRYTSIGIGIAADERKKALAVEMVDNLENTRVTVYLSEGDIINIGNCALDEGLNVRLKRREAK